MHINVDASGRLSDISGQLALSSPNVRLNGLKFDELTAKAEFTKNSFKVSSLSGILADGKIEGSLSVDKTNNALSYDSDIKLTQLNTAKLLSMLTTNHELRITNYESPLANQQSAVTFPKIEGFLNGALKIRNNQANLETISFGGFELIDCFINDVKIADSEAHYEIKNGKISLDANIDSAQVSMDGEVGLSSPLALDFRIDQIDTGKLSEILNTPEFSGTGSLTGKLTKAHSPRLKSGAIITQHSRSSWIAKSTANHQPPSRSTPALPTRKGDPIRGEAISNRIQARISIPNAALYDVPIGMVDGYLDYIDGKIAIEELTVEQDQTQCNIRGTAELSDKIPIQLEAKFNPIEISKYRRLLFGGDYPISGLMTGSISIYGDLEKLDGEGNIKITDGKVWGLEIDPFVLPLKLDSSTVYIPNLVVTSRGQKAYLSAKISPNGDYEFSLETELYPLDLLQRSNLATLPFSSKLICKATGIGNVSNPEFDIDLDLTDIQYANQSFGDLNLSGEYRNNTLSFQGSALDKTCEIDGKFVRSSKAGFASMPYELNLKGKKVDLARFLAIVDVNLPERLEGEVDGTIQISGKLEDPDAMKIELTLPRVALHGNGGDIINRNSINLEFSKKGLHINSFDLVTKSSEQSLLKLSGDIDFQTIPKGERVTNYESRIENEKTRVKSDKVKREKIITQTANASLKKHSSLITHHSSLITFSDLVVSSSAFDLELVSKILGIKLPISGVPFGGFAPNFKLNLTGPVYSPVFTLDYQIPRLVVNWQKSKRVKRQIEIDDFSGKLVYRDNLLKVDCKGKPVGSQKAKDVNQIHLTGEIPVDLALVQKQVEERLLDEPMDVEILAQIRAELLDYFLPDLIESSGVLELTAQIKNTPKQPEITGTIDFEDVNLTSSLLPQPIENGKGNIVFSIQNKRDACATKSEIECVLKEANFQMGKGDYNAKGRFAPTRLKSGAISRVASGDMRFSVNLSGKNIELEPLVNHLTNQKLAFNGSCDANLLISGTGFDTDNSLNAVLTSDRFEISSKLSNSSAIHNLQPIRIELRDNLLRFESFHLGTASETVSISGQFCPFATTEITNQQHSSLPPTEIGGYHHSNGYRLFKETLNISTHEIDLAKWMAMLNLPFSLAARLSLDIEIGGLIESPIIEASFRLDKPITPEQDGSMFYSFVNEITGSLSYRDKLLTLNKTQIDLYDSVIQAEGKVPIDLSFTRKPTERRILDKPMDLTLKGDDIEIAFLSSVSKSIEEMKGVAAINLAVKGTSARPHYEGTLKISDLFAKLSNFDRPIRNGKLELEAIEGIILLEHLSCQMGLTSFLANGNIRMDGIIPKRLNIENFKMRNAQINYFARAFLDDKFAEHLFGHVTAEANMKVNLASQFRRAGKPESQRAILEGKVRERVSLKRRQPLSEKIRNRKSEIRNRNNRQSSIVNLQLKDVLIEWRDEKSSVAKYRVRNSQDIEVTLKNRRLYFDDFVLEDAMGESMTHPIKITVEGDFKIDEKLLFGIEVRNFDVGPIASWINSPYELAGRLNSRLRVRGSACSPVIEIDWNGEGLTVTKANIDKFSGKLTYSDQNLKLTEGQITIGKNYAQFSASIPIDLAFTNHQQKRESEFLLRGVSRQVSFFKEASAVKRVSLKRRQPLSEQNNRLPITDYRLPSFEAQLDMKIYDFEFAPLVDTKLAYADGNGEVNVTLGGQISNPSISGLARLDNISFSLPDSYIKVKDAKFSAKIDESGIKIDQLFGELNGGDCEIQGEIGLVFPTWLNLPETKELDLSLICDNCVFESGLWDRIKCDGDVRISGNTDMPVLEGTVIIDEAIYKQSLEELVRYWTSKNVELQTSAWYDVPLLRNMVLNVEVQAPNNLRVTTGPVTVEASAYGRIVGEVEKPVFEGHADILQGEFWYLDHKFIINEGYLSNQDPYRFNPKYFISAEIDEPLENIELVDTEGQSHIRDIEINVNFSGYLEEHNPPDLSAEVLQKGLGEHYEFDRQQIISLLTVGSVNVVDANGMFFMTDTASAMLRKQAELYVSNRLAKLIGFRSFRFDFTPDSLQQSRFLLTKDLTKRWAITYSSTLQQIYEEPYIEVEYQLNKHIAIKGERDEEGEFGVDLKLEYEFK